MLGIHENFIRATSVAGLSVLCLCLAVGNVLKMSAALSQSSLKESVPVSGDGAVQQQTAEAVAKLGWFGAVPGEDAGSGNAAKPKLSDIFELKGVSQSPDTVVAGAFIAEKGQMEKGLAEKYYRRGDALPQNAGKLLDVFADHVTVQSGVSVLTLGFPNAWAVAQNTAQPGIAATDDKSPYTLMPPDPPVPVKHDPSKAELVKQFITDPDKLLLQAGLSSVRPGEKAGYEFNGGDTAGVFAHAGIMPGDIIQSVNGRAVGNPRTDSLLIPLMAGLKTVDFTVQRGDQHVVVHYTVP